MLLSFEFEIKMLPTLLHFTGTTHSTTSTPQAAKLVLSGTGLCPTLISVYVDLTILSKDDSCSCRSL